MKYVSLFSGIGGLESSNVLPEMLCDINPACRSALQLRFPSIPVWDDVCTLNPPLADVVAGGFPCQDISTGGKQAGFSGHRSSLFYQMLRVASECRASTIVAENVPNLIDMQGGAVMRAVIARLGSIRSGGDCSTLGSSGCRNSGIGSSWSHRSAPTSHGACTARFRAWSPKIRQVPRMGSTGQREFSPSATHADSLRHSRSVPRCRSRHPPRCFSTEWFENSPRLSVCGFKVSTLTPSTESPKRTCCLWLATPFRYRLVTS